MILGIIALVILAVAVGLGWAVVARRALPPPDPLNADPEIRNRRQGAAPPRVVDTEEVRSPDMRGRPREHASPKY